MAIQFTGSIPPVTFQTFPTVLLAHAFSYVTVFEFMHMNLVCKDWKKVCGSVHAMRSHIPIVSALNERLTDIYSVSISLTRYLKQSSSQELSKYFQSAGRQSMQQRLKYLIGNEVLRMPNNVEDCIKEGERQFNTITPGIIFKGLTNSGIKKYLRELRLEIRANPSLDHVTFVYNQLIARSSSNAITKKRSCYVVPSSLLVCIFTYLTPIEYTQEVRRVCRLWHGVSLQSPALQAQIRFCNAGLKPFFAIRTTLEFLQIREAVTSPSFIRGFFQDDAAKPLERRFMYLLGKEINIRPRRLKGVYIDLFSFVARTALKIDRWDEKHRQAGLKAAQAYSQELREKIENHPEWRRLNSAENCLKRDLFFLNVRKVLQS